MEWENHRRSTRVQTEMRVELHLEGGGVFEGSLKDVSLTGVFVCCDWPAGLYGPVEVNIFLDGQIPPIRIASEGRVIRHGEEGIAVELVHTERDSLIHLLRLLAFNLGDPEQIGREVAKLGLDRGL